MTDLHYSPNLLLVMDCLWYHQIVLFSEPIPKPTPTSQPSSSSQTSLASLSDLSSTPLLPEEEDYSSSSSSETSPKDDSSASGDDTDADDDDDDDDYEELHYRRKRRSATTKNSRSTCSSPSLPKHLRNIIGFDTPLIKKTMSCKTLFELEYEEVKGFMDLGFTFNKEKLCPRMMSVIPGLQRLDEYFNKEGVDEQELGKQSGVMRPYLSEAWLIKRPDSPLLNLRIPRVTTADDMKKHLKYWARTVASAIEQGRGLN